MSLPSSPMLDLDVRTRRAERRIAALIIAIGLTGPWLLQIPSGLSLLLSLGLVASFGLGLRYAGWLGGTDALVHIAWLSDGRWFLTNQRGARIEAALEPDTRRGPGGVWLQWRETASGVRHSMLLLRGDLADDGLRRLLVRLGIDGCPAPGEPGFLSDGDTGTGQRAGALTSQLPAPITRLLRAACAKVMVGRGHVASSHQQ